MGNRDGGPFAAGNSGMFLIEQMLKGQTAACCATRRE